MIIPTYSHREFVGEALESVFAQTFTDYEVIVVNDGSADDTGELLRPLAEAGRIRYFEQANAGQAAARNRGLVEARGEFVAFLDDDDLWPGDKLEWQVAALHSDPEICAVGGEQVFHLPPPSVTTPTGPSDLLNREALFFGCPFSSPGLLLFRAAAVREIGGFDPTVWGADDYDLYLRLSRRAPIKRVRRGALYYRLHEGNASRQKERMYVNSARCLRLRLREVPLTRRWAMARRSYRWLYNYLGEQLLRESRSSERILSTWHVLLNLLPGLLCDPRLLWWVISVLRA